MVARRPNTEESNRRSNHRAIGARRHRGGGFPDGGLLGLLADLIRQSRDLTEAAHPILKILPEVDSQPPARLLQARERVSCLPTQITPGAAADLPLLDVVPDVPL